MASALSTTNRKHLKSYAPLENIPNELWSIIFCYCLATDVSPFTLFRPSEEISVDQRLVPFILASVCTTWRKIACNDTPKLWSTCWLSFRHPKINTVWLGRAGNLMLRLYGKEVNEEWCWIQLFQSIMPFQKRWKTLALATSVYIGDTRNVPVLDETGLTSLKIGSENDSFWVVEVVAKSPYLDQVEISSISLLEEVLLESSIAQRLTVLKLWDWLTPERSASLLLEFPRLQNLEIMVHGDHIDHIDHIDQSSPGKIVHSSLCRLQITTGSYNTPYISTFFDFLTLPSLRALRIMSRFAPQTLIDFMDRSQARITEFAFADSSVGDYFEALRKMRWLEKVEFIGETDIISSELCDLLKDTNQFPHLTQIRFPGHEIYDEDEDGIIADLLISRAQPRICTCEECFGGQHARRVRLEYALVYGLDKESRILDITQLVPLPGDRVEDDRCARMIIDLVLKEDGEEGEESQELHFLIGDSAWNRRLDNELYS